MIYTIVNAILVIAQLLIFFLSGLALFRYHYFLAKKVDARGAAYKKQADEMRSTVEREIENSIRSKLDLVVGEKIETKMRREILNILEKAFDSILHHHLWKDEDNVIRKSIINLMIEEIIKVKSRDLKND